MEYLVTFENGTEGYLSHHGVKGMSWGIWSPTTVRKYKQGNGGSNVSSRWKKSDGAVKGTSDKNAKSKKNAASSKKVETVIDEGKKWKLKEDPLHKGYYIRDGLANASKKKASNGKLAVDGIWGRKTQAELQRQLGLKGSGKKDATTTKTLQSVLGVKASGKMDKATVSALNNALGSNKKGAVSVKELQKALNQKKVKNNR